MIVERVVFVYTLSRRAKPGVPSPHSRGEEGKYSAVYVVTRSTLRIVSTMLINGSIWNMRIVSAVIARGVSGEMR